MSPCAHGSQSHVSSLSCLSSLFYTACCHTNKKFTHTVDSSGETERHNSGIVDFPASHRLEAARPPTNLPPTSLLRGYRPQRVVVAPPRHATRPRPGPAPRPLARSPDQPAGAPPRGRARVRRPYYTLVVTRGFSLYRIGLYVTLLQL